MKGNVGEREKAPKPLQSTKKIRVCTAFPLSATNMGKKGTTYFIRRQLSKGKAASAAMAFSTARTTASLNKTGRPKIDALNLRDSGKGLKQQRLCTGSEESGELAIYIGAPPKALSRYK
jgi:hypothetical protein